MEDSRCVWDDAECTLRYLNLSRILDPRRAFLPAFRVTGISDDCYRSTMGVIVIDLGTPQSTWENYGCTCNHRQQAGERWQKSREHLWVPMTSLGAPATCLRAPQITVEKSGKKPLSLGTLLVNLEIIATTCRSTIVKSHVFCLYSHKCIYVFI
jgi:hypothetical protein